jgi:hypothetical protein|tara:strand:+ start:6821 stop:7345 length:525 start_codon:yes stop_codon:yes gene_type:complete
VIEQESSEEPEDVAGAAGWMFSDMLIALMVVFLATISFIPQSLNSDGSILSGGDGNSQSVVGGNFSYVERFEQVFIYTYRLSEVRLVLGDIEQFLENYDLPKDSVVDSAQFISGYVQGESSQLAIQRAINFSRTLEALAPELFIRAATVLNTSSQLPEDLVTLRLTFSARISTN